MPKSRSKRAALSAALLLAALVLAEAALRAAGFGGPLRERPDPDLGWAPAERPLLLAKPPGVWRVAVLGDESVAGLLSSLEACADTRPVEVVDFAVPGYGTAQQYVQLQTQVLRHEPDLVLLHFNAANDVRNNSFLLEPRKDRPFFFLDAAGRLSVDASFAGSRAFRERLSVRAQVLRAVRERSRLLQLVAGEDPAPALDGDPGMWREAWRVTESLVEAIEQLARRSGVPLAIALAGEEERLQALAARRAIPLVALGYAGRAATAARLAQALCMRLPAQGQRLGGSPDDS